MKEHDITGKCLSTVALWRPDRMVSSAWIEHGPFAFWLVRQLKPRVFVELGTHNGFSFSAFCQAVQALDLPTSCTAVDTWQGDEHAGFYADSIYDEFKGYSERYASFARLLRMTFDEARHEFADKSVDLLHVDGRHFYDDVRYDYESWVPKLADNAVVLFHDTNVFERGFGVHQFWKEISERYPSFEFKHGHGLGVACIGDTVPDGLRGLFEAAGAPETADAVRLTYARLGKTVSDLYEQQSRIQDLEGQCVANTGEIALALKEIARKADEVQVLRTALDQETGRHQDTIRAFEQTLSWRVTTALRSPRFAAIRRFFGRRT